MIKFQKVFRLTAVSKGIFQWLLSIKENGYVFLVRLDLILSMAL